MSVATSITLLRCSTCGSYFADEPAIRTHQDLHARLAAHDPALDRHDGEPWMTETISVGDMWVGRARGKVLRVEADEDGNRCWVLDTGSYIGDFSDTELARFATSSLDADATRLREFAAAQALGIEDDEVCVGTHILERRRRWTSRAGVDTQFQVEMFETLARIGLLILNTARTGDKT